MLSLVTSDRKQGKGISADVPILRSLTAITMSTVTQLCALIEDAPPKKKLPLRQSLLHTSCYVCPLFCIHPCYVCPLFCSTSLLCLSTHMHALWQFLQSSSSGRILTSSFLSRVSKRHFPEAKFMTKPLNTTLHVQGTPARAKFLPNMSARTSPAGSLSALVS